MLIEYLETPDISILIVLTTGASPVLHYAIPPPLTVRQIRGGGGMS